MELWDAYDAQLHRLEGVTLIRGEPIPAGMYHLVCEVLVRHTDGDYLMMQRDPAKHLGGMWEATACGSALQGEAAEACARRELLEETGVAAGVLRPLGCETSRERQAHYAAFLCVTDMAKERVSLQEGETVAFRWVTKDVLLSIADEALATRRILRYVGACSEEAPAD